jgi:hypothetical protein
MKEGLYFLKRQGEEPVLVHGYNCTDLNGEFVFGFNTHDGGGLVPLSDLCEDTIIVPVTIVEKQQINSQSVVCMRHNRYTDCTLDFKRICSDKPCMISRDTLIV